MKIPAVVASLHEWPAVPGSAVIVQREGSLLPRGYWRVLSRVWPNLDVDDGTPFDILLVVPMPAQAWWERSEDRELTRASMTLNGDYSRLPVAA